MSGTKRNRGWVRAAVAGALAAVVVAAAAVLLPGCGDPPVYPPDLTFGPREDRLVVRVPAAQPAGTGEPGKMDAELAGLDAAGGRTVDPAELPADQRRALDDFLARTFGTPAAPTVTGDAAVVASAAHLGLTPERLAEGGRLFRRHCLQCHGLSGDGRGPTGQWIFPHPRDFRRGAFKFVSTGDGGKPRAADLARTIRDGLNGTAMPAFGLLPDEQREVMARYVVYLGLRGQVEFQTIAALLPDPAGGGSPEDDAAGQARDQLAGLLRQWERAEAAPPGPTPPPVPDDDGKQADGHLASVRRGYELFTAKGVTDCTTCHEDFGRKATYRYDVWGTVVRPADLTAGGFKGGDRPEDLYHRVRGGIRPSGMPAHPGLTDAQVWELVTFVRALPHPRELPPDVRAAVYPSK